MKISTFLIFAIFLSYSAFGQVSFDWHTQEISPDNNLQEMNIVNDTTTILAGYGRTFRKSADLGITWDEVRLLDPSFDFVDISINANGIGYACSGDEQVINNPTDGELDVYAEGVLLKTIDNGSTWSVFDISKIGQGIEDPLLSPNAPGCYSQHFRAVEVIDDNTALLGIEWYYFDQVMENRASHAGVFKTVDGGESWVCITNNDSYPMAIELAVSTIYFGGSNHLLKTVAGSDVVTDIYPNLIAVTGGDNTVFINDFTIVSESEVYVVTSTNGIYKTVDMGATFTKLGNGAPEGSNDLYIINESVMLALGSSARSALTVDGGLSWTLFYPSAVCYEIGGVFNDTLYGLATSKVYKIAVSDIIASNSKWTSQTLSDGNNLQKMHIIDANNAIIVGNGGAFQVTSDAGLNWEQDDLPELFVYGAEYDFSAVSTSGEASYTSTRRFLQLDYPTSSIYEDYYAHGLIYKSLDYWNTWELIDVGTIGEGTDPSLNPNMTGCYGLSPTEIECTNANTVYVYVTWNDTTAGKANKKYHSRVFKSTDSGSTWVSLTEDFGSRYVNSIKFLDENNGFIAGNTILLRTNDGGATFTDLYPTVITVSGDSTIFIYDLIYIDENEWFVQTSTNGVYATYDGGASYKKFVGIEGGSDFYKLDENSYIVLGGSTKSKLSWDKGESWINCYPGSSIWSIGGVLNDSLVALAKSNLYKIALSELKAPNTEANILTFVLAEQTGDAIIDAGAHTVAIEVATGTNLTNLSPTITLSEGATVSPASGVAQDFTNPVTYTVKAEDGTTTQAWVVTVTKLVNTPKNLVGNITLYPNPAADKLFLTNLDNVNRINIVSIIGKSVFSSDSDTNRMEINLSAFEKGIYFISFYEKDGTVKTKKFIKE
ncbi:MAG: DUF5018 domain-containing protein [Bacteroidales bacterium]|nr:DUF5018 domain-containing protein [Bacteroidales bacterium]MCF8390829.1 DUF5018 domain-containing protein [Bacteroidales bacterium]